MSHCQTAKGQSQPLTENTGLGHRMMNELESRDDGGCWSTRLPYTASWVLSPALQTANGKGDKGKCVTSLGQRYLGAGTMARCWSPFLPNLVPWSSIASTVEKKAIREILWRATDCSCPVSIQHDLCFPEHKALKEKAGKEPT